MFEKQIEAGVKYLDENYPGWLDKIDLDKLDLASPCNCVLGQVAGIQVYYYAKFGFAIPGVCDNTTHWRTNPNWDILKQEWTEKIIELREHAELCKEFETLQDEFHSLGLCHEMA